METVKLTNRTSVRKPVWVSRDGLMQEVVLLPNSSAALDSDVAAKMLEAYPGAVTLYQEQAFSYAAGEPSVFVANLTGNPFVPDTIEALVDGRVQVIPHPLARPRTIRRTLARSEVMIDKDRPTEKVLHTPPQIVEVAPYERLCVPESVGQWLVARESIPQLSHAPALALVREPSGFEPNSLWDYENMRSYAMLLDPDFFTAARMKHDFPTTQALDKTKVAERKEVLLVHLFHRLIDSNYGLPPKEAFDTFRAQNKSVKG